MARQRLGSGENGGALGASPVPRIALTREEAAHALGMSLDSFERHVQPEIRLVRRGKLRLVPVREIERWAEQSATAAVE